MACPKCRNDIRVPTLEELRPRESDSSRKPQPKREAPREETSPPKWHDAPQSEAAEEARAAGTDRHAAVEELAAAGTAPRADFMERTFEEEAGPGTHPSAPAGKTAAAAVVIPEHDRAGRLARVLPVHAEDEDDEFVMRKSETEFEEMDLTPMVDVTFLLLIFFMITASFSLQKALDVPAPDPDEKGAAQQMTLEDLETDSVIVEIDENNVIYVDEAALNDADELIAALEEKMRMEQKTELVLEASDEALHEYVVRVVDAANEVGMQRIRIATRAGN